MFMRFPSCIPVLLVVLTLLNGRPLAMAAESAHLRATFREPAPASYLIRQAPMVNLLSLPQNQTATAVNEQDPSQQVEFEDRVVLQFKPGVDARAIAAAWNLSLDREIAPGVFILQAASSFHAIQAAHQLARDEEGVIVSYPVSRRPKSLLGTYAPTPNDPYFSDQWNHENRNASGFQTGPDLNSRAAWQRTRGAGVTVAVADEGVELSHPDLATSVAGAPHHNFQTGSTNGNHTLSGQAHGTAVAGLVTGEQNNNRGITGVAPEASLASWVIFGTDGFLVSEEAVLDMFQHSWDEVWVQNHSWGSASTSLVGPTFLENIGLSNAVTFGRNGLGVVMVRAAGNGRDDGMIVNDDGYASDPRAIAVAAVRNDGRATSYSSPGAALLVAAPAGDLGFKALVTTDRQGQSGYNRQLTTGDSSDYVFDNSFDGTSASAPQIAGLAALLLSVNPQLHYRDIQQILLLSARQFDPDDPDLSANGAGLLFSHNTGFGVPDAGVAVDLAAQWIPRPPSVRVESSQTTARAIPDGSFRLQLSGPGISPSNSRIAGWPALGPFPSRDNLALPITDVGLATDPIKKTLHNHAALIERGVSFFSDKLDHAAGAGASFAIVSNNKDSDALLLMGGTDYSRIPSIFISQNDGALLRDLLAAHPETRARLDYSPAVFQFDVEEQLQCEYVSVRLKSNHPDRSQLRIMLTSPAGSQSILQTQNFDVSAGPSDWTYHSTKHFYEGSRGRWTLELVDQVAGQAGSVTEATLMIRGVPITDIDSDGLHDDWEREQFGNLTLSAKDDPDEDGLTNLRELLLNYSPTVGNRHLKLQLSSWNDSHWRLAWPGKPGTSYRLLGRPSLTAPETLIATIPGRFPETEFFLSHAGTARFLRLQVVENP